VDVDAISDGQITVIGAIMEHIEEAGIHSGDSACVTPPQALPPAVCEEITRQTKALSAALKVVGLMNVQYAVQGDRIYVLEVNPRASRTIPFRLEGRRRVAGPTGHKIMLGHSLKDLA